MGFKEDLAAAKVAPRRTADVEVTLNGVIHTLRFTQLEGTDYAAETIRHPMRPDVQADQTYGYNVDSLIIAVAPRSGRLVDGDDLVELSAEEWSDMFTTINGRDASNIINTIFVLNEYASDSQAAALKKALAVAVKKMTSPSS